MSIIKEFQEFIARGNVLDLAVGVVIGGAFTSIVNSLVKDIITPPIGYLTSGIDFASLSITLRPEYYAAAANAKPTDPPVLHPAVLITYGNFINAVISFLIVSFVIFLVVKGSNILKRRLASAEADKPAPAPAPEVVLLTEIRDLLRNK